MRPATILHVEDDPDLAKLVSMQFQSLGFQGVSLTAGTVDEARTLLESMAQKDLAVDLILTDMRLPDGTGLQIVEYVRNSPRWSRTPILILSSDRDPEKVGRAYALGANAYVAKTGRGRSTDQIVKTLYDHWLRDAQWPNHEEPRSVRGLLCAAANLRNRFATVCMRFARQFGDNPFAAAFWMTQAMRAGNIASLLSFLALHVEDKELPADLAIAMKPVLAEVERARTAMEREIEHRPVSTHEEAVGSLLRALGSVDVDPLVSLINHLFSLEPLLMRALLDVIVHNLGDVADWLDSPTGIAALRSESTRLRARATYLRRTFPSAAADA